jgi:hypothetical protein
MVLARGTRHGRSGNGKKQNADALPIQRQQSTTETVEQLLSLRIRLQRWLLKAECSRRVSCLWPAAFAARAPIERRNRELPGEGLLQSRGEPLDSDAALSLNPSEYKWSAAIARLLGSPFEHRAICWALQHLIGLIAVSARSQRAWPCTASGRFMSVFSSSEATGAWASLRCSRAPSSREVALGPVNTTC